MADSSLILTEAQAFYDMQAKEAEARLFGAMLFTPDNDGNLGAVTDVTSVLRVQYNDGSSSRIHTSDAFSYFFNEFVKANADELFTRALQKAIEMVREQQQKAAAEVNSQLDLSIVDDSGGTAVPAPVITSQLLTVGYVNEPMTYYIVAANSTFPSAPTTYDAKNLPKGLVLDSSTGVISGVVDKAGVYPVTIIAKSVAGKDQKVLQITVANRSAPGIPPTSLPTIFGALTATAREGDPFTFACSASNLPSGNLGVTWGATGLPSGLSIGPVTGVISGTPAIGTAGTYTITLAVTTTAGTDTETLTLTVDPAPAPVITSPLTVAIQEESAFSYAATATDAVGGTWSATGLPTSLSINASTGAITGTPVVGDAGSYSINLTVTTAAGSDTKTVILTITALPAPVITSAATATATEGTAFSFAAAAANVPASGVTWAASGLPASLSINASTGVISGTPATGDSSSSPYAVTLTATGANGSGSQSFTLTVNP